MRAFRNKPNQCLLQTCKAHTTGDRTRRTHQKQARLLAHKNVLFGREATCDKAQGKRQHIGWQKARQALYGRNGHLRSISKA